MQKPNPGGGRAASDPGASGGARFALSAPAAAIRSAFDRAWFGPALIAAAAAAMLAWSWNTWADPWVDFGQQLYLAWRISAGDVLYRDIAYHHGPLSAYFNAALVRVLGVGLPVVFAANLAGLGVLLTLLYRLVSRLADRPTATLAGLVLVFVFAFGHLGSTQGYNYLAPYVQESTHGLILAVASLSALAKYVVAATKDLDAAIHARHAGGGVISPEIPPFPVASSSPPAVGAPPRARADLWLVFAGLLAGLTFLTKAEPFLAIAAALAIGCVATAWTMGGAGRDIAARLGILSASITVPPMLAFALFCAAMPPHDALFAALGPWPSVLSSQAGGLLAYRAELGLTDPFGNVLKMLFWSAGYAAVVAFAVGAAWAVRWAKRGDGLATAVCFALICAVCALLPARLLFESARPLPLFMLALSVASALGLRRAGGVGARSHNGRRHERRPPGNRLDRPELPAPAARTVLTLTFAVFALAMLAKMFLAPRLFHYGFTLALPAQILLVVALSHRLAALVESRGIPGGGLRGAALAVLVALSCTHVAWSRHYWSQKTATIVSGPETLRARPADADLMNRLLAEIAARSRPADTLVTLPDGMMVNFLSRRASSIPYMYFMPTDLLIYGEERMVAALRDRPPDFIVLIHKDTSEFGYQFFGRDYGRALFAWIIEHYAPAAQIGEFPLREAGKSGVVLLQRRRAAE